MHVYVVQGYARKARAFVMGRGSLETLMIGLICFATWLTRLGINNTHAHTTVQWRLN